jgi:hypothetical protein
MKRTVSLFIIPACLTFAHVNPSAGEAVAQPAAAGETATRHELPERWVTEFGPFVADQSDAATVEQNNATINAAIDQLGRAGGGSIRLPRGTFYIGPDPAKANTAISIRHSNITLRGEGPGRTILKTNGAWNKEKKRRGHGILFDGKGPRVNITLRDFELDGQDGWTGEYQWPATPETGAGWDIQHKGIAFFVNGGVDNVLVENLYVHHYRGEVLYFGGMSVGKMVVRGVKMNHTNGSCFNFYAADLLVEGCEFGGPSRFWCELLARPAQGGFESKGMVFRNNKFWNVPDAKITKPQIAICQGDFKTFPMVFENNEFRDCPDVFGFYFGVAGPITIRDNRVRNCGRLVTFGYSGGWKNSKLNANILVERNQVEEGLGLVEFNAYGVQDIIFRGNRFGGKTGDRIGEAVAVVVANGADVTRGRIEHNLFTASRLPRQPAKLKGERPLFVDNRYKDVPVAANNAPGEIVVSAESPLVLPACEQVRLVAAADNLVPVLETNQYPAGQTIEITGGSPQRRIRFATGQASYAVSSEVILDGRTTLRLRYEKSSNKWVELEPR